MELTDLEVLYAKDPKLAEKALRQHPEWVDQLVEIAKVQKQINDAANKVSLEGFKIAYRLFYNRDLPEIFYPVTRAFVKAFYDKRAVAVEGWRGLGKSTFLTAWCPYVMGVRPFGSTTLIRINDGKAKEAGKAMAEMIETNPGWQKLFPHVIPDKDSGWSVENGFNVMDTRATGPLDAPDFKARYAIWRQKCLADHHSEQSLLCAGIESGSIIGLHPSNGMWFDDLHDESNTRSQAELRKVTDIVGKNVIPTWFSVGGSPTVGVFYTPWSENPPDAYQVMLKTGLFTHLTIPIFKQDDSGDIFEPMNMRVKLSWPEVFPLEKVAEMWYANPAHFGQMYLCDLASLRGLRLKKEWLQEYPFEKLDETWPVYFGIDFASTSDKLKGKDTDYFCCAIGRAIPGGMVLTGGFRGRLSIGEALQKITSLATLYPTLRTIGIEKWGSGKDFAELLRPIIHSSSLPIVTFPFEGRPVLSKGQKFESELAPLFTGGRMWVSSLKDDFIRAFEDEWISWDGTRSLTRHDDALDAVYGMAYVGQGHVMPQAMQTSFKKKERPPSPLTNIGRERGYGLR